MAATTPPLLLLLLLLTLRHVSVEALPTLPTQPMKHDCTPDIAAPTAAECQKRGCAYTASPSNGEPACVLTLTYKESVLEVTRTGYRQFLTPSQQPPFGGDFGDPYLEVDHINDHVTRIKVIDR